MKTASQPLPVCYLPMLEGQTEEIRNWLDGVPERFGILPVMLPPVDWNDDLTPWPVDPIFRKAKAFGGQAPAYLRRLEQDILPAAEAGLGFVPQERWFLGVSLAGLFGIWSAAGSRLFTRVAAISGSFWYPGFTQWLREHPLHASCAYLSLGDREAESKNPHLRGIAAQTAEVVRILQEQGVPTTFEWTEGTHFGPILPRLEKALNALTSAAIR